MSPMIAPHMARRFLLSTTWDVLPAEEIADTHATASVRRVDRRAAPVAGAAAGAT